MNIDDFIEGDEELSKLRARYDKASASTADLRKKAENIEKRLQNSVSKERYARQELDAALFKKAMSSGMLNFGDESDGPSDSDELASGSEPDPSDVTSDPSDPGYRY